MKNFFKLLILFSGLTVSCYAQQSPISAIKEWEMAPIHIKSRWAKDVDPDNVLKEYPRPQMVRKNWKSLNGLWQYAIVQKDIAMPTEFLQHILVPYPIESALSGVKKSLMPDQCLWYKRNIQKPVLAAGERLLLHFGAVDWQATVFVNDKEVGLHTGGYQSFSFDITDYLKEGTNELLVKVYDPTDQGPNPHGKQVLNPANIYYTPTSGIWQTVWMEKVPATYIIGLKITPDIDKGVLNISVNTSATANDLMVEVIAKENGKMVSNIMSELGTDIQLPIPNARLWSPDDPFLYDLSVKLRKGTKGVDQVDSYFGMRKIAIQKDKKGVDRIFLNNQYNYNLGVLDQGFWPEGLYTAPTDEALAFDIKAIKTMGFNTIRKHIKIEPARWYYHADKIGVLIWQDFVNPPHELPEGSKPIFEKETKEIMDQLYNYPSIIAWVLFNERWGAYDQKRLTEWVKAYDPSRLVNGHSGELLYVDEQLRAPSDTPWISSDMADLHSYPDPMSPPALPEKVKILGEFGGVGVSVPGHEWNDLKGWGYVEVSPSELAGKYEIMMKRLKKLEVEGLSGSIYTQPFDVEGEENGLLTYDRKVIKIPVDRLREINQSLVPQTRGFELNPRFNIAQNIDVNDTDERYKELLKKYEKGNRDSTFLRRLTLMAIRQKDQPKATQVGNDYISVLKKLYSKENLMFISQITRTSNDKGFKLFRIEHEKINAVLGSNQAESIVRNIIGKEEIEPYMTRNQAQPDWDSIEKVIVNQYGTIGEEKLYGARMIYYLDKQDWTNFGRFYALYFERAVTRSEYHINNVSWSIFEHVIDPDVLKVAVNTMRYNLDFFAKDDPTDMDTYANLLYKLGKKNEAIEWEEKAVRASNNGKDFVETLEKMKMGLPTWLMFGSTN